MIRIFIDPGHGGSDPGATANGLREKDICLTIALRLRDFLNQENASHSIKLSRTTDQTLSLKKRTDMANQFGADILVSVHINAGGATGFESYVYNGKFTNKGETDCVRNVIHDEIVKETQFNDRGKKEANFHMLRESSMPSVLTENGFIDTINDAHRLRDESFLNQIARSHAKGIAKALRLHQKKSDRKRVPKNSEISEFAHIIQQGDTLWELAKRYRTTVLQLRKWNPGIVPEFLQIGQQLVVTGAGGTATHTIQEGDTLWQLAKKYHTTVIQLLQLNNGLAPKRLPIGKDIRVR